MIKYDIIFFDYDGTLVDNAVVAFTVCNKMLASFYGLPEISFDRFRETFIVPWQEFYYKNGVPRDSIDVAKHQAAYQDFDRKERQKGLNLKSKTLDLLEFLATKKVRIGLLSSRNIEDLTNELKVLNIDKYFECVVGSESILKDGVTSSKKGDIAIQRMNIANDQHVLYVGDMTTDASLAAEYKWDCALLGDGWQSREILQKVINAKTQYFENLQSFYSFFEKLRYPA